MAVNPIAEAITYALSSPNESDRNGEAANVVDGLFAIARAINGLAKAIEAKPSPNKDRLSELRSMPYSDYLATPEWTATRQRAINAADGRCQLCYSNQSIDVHHRTYERRGAELPYDLTVLCRDCHAKFHDKLPKEETTKDWWDIDE